MTTLPPPTGLTATATILVVCFAVATDVSRRRIPNALTFPAIGAGLLIGAVTGGWWGWIAALMGAMLTPSVLMAVRLGNRVGQGDLKLAAAVGSLVGPAVGVLAMLFAAVVGGLLAIAWMLRPGTAVSETLSPFLIGVPFLGSRYAAKQSSGEPVATIRIPYGVAIALGSLLALAVVGAPAARW
ncbi:MAG: A24 family peptidase [bacterium]